MKRLLRLSTIATLGVVLPAAAQTANRQEPTIQALLNEVRQLRLALEKSALLAPKLQLTLQRMQIQEQKVSRLSAQLDAVRKEITQEAAMPGKAAEELAAVEERISGETDPSRRRQLEDHRAVLKRMVQRVDVDPQLRTREIEITTALRHEQAALNELNEKLNAMERLLEAPQP